MILCDRLSKIQHIQNIFPHNTCFLALREKKGLTDTAVEDAREQFGAQVLSIGGLEATLSRVLRRPTYGEY